MVPYAGWSMPVQYQGVTSEHQAVRNGVGVFDVSHMGQLHVRGRDAVAAVNRLITNDLSVAVDGRGIYTCCCNERGTILDDLIVYRLAPEHVLVVCNAANRDKIVGHFERELTLPVALDDDSALLAVQGPGAAALLTRLFGQDPFAELRPFRIGSFHLLPATPGANTAPALRVARTGYTGEDGVELFCSNAQAVGVFDALLDSGAVPCGLAARDTLRLEAALSLYGNDIDETTTPLEAGLGWTVKFDKAEFIGKAALQHQREQGIQRRLVGFEMLGRGIARAGYPLLDAQGKVIGRCTSGSPSPTLGKSIGLGYVPLGHDATGTQLLVDCRGRSVPAQVVGTPFYKRPKDVRAVSSSQAPRTS